MSDRTRSTALVVSLVALAAIALVVACGGDSDDDTDGMPTNVPTANSSSDGNATAAPSVGSSDDPLAQFLVDTAIAWESCDQLAIDDGTFTVSCGFRTHPFFENWQTRLNYELDADGTRIGVTGSVRGYGSTCEWDPPAGETYEAELVAGVATYEGTVLGSGACDGLRWRYAQTWDDEGRTVVTSGPIERID